MKVYVFRNKRTGEVETRLFTAIRHVKCHIVQESKKPYTGRDFSGVELIEFDLSEIEGKVVKL